MSEEKPAGSDRIFVSPSGLRPHIAPVGLLIDLVRVVPGYERVCIPPRPATDDATSIMFLVLGEWDMLRLSLVSRFFPRPSKTQFWPPLGVPIRNQHSFLSHVWMEDDGLPPAALTRNSPTAAEGAPSGGLWQFSPAFLDRESPVTLLICVKLHTVFARRFGIEADYRLVRYISTRADARGLLALPAGSIGWQEMVFVVRAQAFEAARELVRDIYEAPVSDLFSNVSPEILDEVLAYPLAACTITYPCLFPESDPGGEPGPSKFVRDTVPGARLMLDVRPGIRNPLRSGPLAVNAGRITFGGLPCAVTEMFGEYDLEIRFPDNTPLLGILGAVREIRSTNREFPNWLNGTAMVLEFNWHYQKSPEQPLVPDRPAGEPFDAEMVRQIVGKFRWKGVGGIHSERLVAILRRVYSYVTDPVLLDSVKPLARYFKALLLQIRDAYAQTEPPPAEIVIEPEDIEQLCSILEFSLRQRSEGLQQFLFNGLPNSYYGRGGINRLLVGADGILQEVASHFQIVNPGFVVFGLPNRDGFACFGPIVIAPTPSLFELESWWILFHQAALYIDDQLFQLDFDENLIADILTLALPFRFDRELMSRMHAHRLASIEQTRAESSMRGVASRMAMLVVLQDVADELIRLFPEGEGMEETIWLKTMDQRAHRLRRDESFQQLVRVAIDQFLHDLRLFSLPYRQEAVPKTAADLGFPDMLEELAERCERLREFWNRARDERSDAFWATGYLLQALHSRKVEVQSHPDAHAVSNDALLGLNSLSIADLVHRAMRRWEACREEEEESLQSRPDVEDRLSEFLALWHRGTKIASYSEETTYEGLQ